MSALETILRERPAFHAMETEIGRSFAAGESFLQEAEARRLASEGTTCYGLGADVLRCLGSHVSEEMTTLETGAGCSTLVFALRGANHTAVVGRGRQHSRLCVESWG